MIRGCPIFPALTETDSVEVDIHPIADSWFTVFPAERSTAPPVGVAAPAGIPWKRSRPSTSAMVRQRKDLSAPGREPRLDHFAGCFPTTDRNLAFSGVLRPGEGGPHRSKCPEFSNRASTSAVTAVCRSRKRTRPLVMRSRFVSHVRMSGRSRSVTRLRSS